MSRALAGAIAVRRWDIEEIKRIGRFNYDLAITFARNRLIRRQCHRPGDNARLATLPTENFDLFFRIHTAAEELEEMKATITEVERLA